jgi:hypothetical protein
MLIGRVLCRQEWPIHLLSRAECGDLHDVWHARLCAAVKERHRPGVLQPMEIAVQRTRRIDDGIHPRQPAMPIIGGVMHQIRPNRLTNREAPLVDVRLPPCADNQVAACHQRCDDAAADEPVGSNQKDTHHQHPSAELSPIFMQQISSLRRSSVFGRRENMADKSASQNKSDLNDQATTEEARRLAQEAMDEMKRGNKEEAEVVLNEARDLDKTAVDEIVQEHKKK